ncbi:NERD domain-containing protein [Paenibacillus sp. P96]|uniref:NERD domain-containing protein n=1 Tax=Paenibacillus zeirhizosphaerae TaxID=2987519 RepID=A0ABT9FRJ2_9BACL|nr:nuclease-related domain-containing protein [Paenibacillus sp. P96]MDP4097354.1 NERD domain-containing protein [Paenibacillus sp. P96]
MFKKFISLFTPGKNSATKRQDQNTSKPTVSKTGPKVKPTRIGELGEYKINIQLDQLPKGCKYLSDLLITNPKARSGYSQIDHVAITPRGLFVIETKNYNGEIKGSRKERNWRVSNRFNMYNPFMQNFGHIQAIKGHLGDFEGIRAISLVSFTMRCRFSVDPELRQISSDELIVYDVELSEYIQRKLNRLQEQEESPVYSAAEIHSIYDVLLKANITDPAVRALHIEKAGSKTAK